LWFGDWVLFVIWCSGFGIFLSGGFMPGLFDPLKIKDVELRNRIVFAPVVTNFGLRNEQTTGYYAERARGGAGLIIIHGTPVDLFLKMDWVQRLKPLIEAVHREGARVVIQLWHGNDLKGEPVAPSAQGPCRAITRAEIRVVIEKFAAAAHHCREAGFDGAEVHGAHGYFINQFFSPLTNQRNDDYGGSLDRRMRLAAELIGGMRKAAGEGLLLLYRHSAVDGEPGGTTVEESIQLGKALETHGLDILDVSAGRGQKDNLSIPESSALEGTHAHLADRIKAAVSIPVIAVGRIQTRAVADRILQEGKADLIALGRQLLADPFWPEKLRQGKEEDVVLCTYCDTCTHEMRNGKPISCPQNPRLGKEAGFG
jgi:2,4-dienoyl-CoA reductase-like NADH-dependent reductase (Old Yellow Enzyme family)